MACVTAHYLDSKAKYDPMSIFLSSKIDLVPYQIYDFNHLMSEERTHGMIRALIAYETGLGKTILVGMLIKELMVKSQGVSNPIRRVLIVTPPSVLLQFQSEMKEKFDLDFVEFEPNNPRYSNLMIGSMETLKTDTWKEWLSNQLWDLVVIDEFHRVSPSNMRGSLAELLSKKAKHFIALTATPHDGRSDRYNFRLSTISTKPLVIRRTKKEVVDINNKKIFDQEVNESTEEPTITGEELTFYNEAETYVKNRYKARGGALLAVLIGRAISSSIRTGLKFLKKRKGNLALGKVRGMSDDLVDELEEKLQESGELSEEDIESVLSMISGDREELEAELAEITPLIKMGQNLVDNLPIDSKGNYLKRIVSNAITEGRKIIIFTGFRETVNYLNEILAEYSPFEITGSVTMSERKKIVDDFTKNEKYKIIIGTDAMGESLNLQAASEEVNYEVPWAPVAYIQRVGRIWRFKQKQKSLYIRNFLPQFAIEKRVMEVILQKINTINREFGEVGLSVFGRELGTVDQLVQQAYKGKEIERNIIEAARKTEEMGKEVMEVLKNSMSLPTIVNAEVLQRANVANIDESFSEEDMRRFLQYMKDANRAAGVIPVNTQEPSTFHIFFDNEYVKVASLSLSDRGIKAAIDVGKSLLKKGTPKVYFSSRKPMLGRISIMETRINGSIVYSEPVLINDDGILTYRGILSLAPVFTGRISYVSFSSLEEYRERTGKRWFDYIYSIWEETRKMKWRQVLEEEDAFRKEGLRKSLEEFIQLRPTMISVTEASETIGTVEFVVNISEEEYVSRYEVEMDAMKTCIDYYKNKGYRILDVSRYNRGYDIECSKINEILRVEIKGLRGAIYPELTQNERKQALFYKENYILFIVKITEKEKIKYAVSDPLSKLRVTEILKPYYQTSGFENFIILD